MADTTATPERPPRPNSRVLAFVCVGLIGLLAYRSYKPHFDSRPTQDGPARPVDLNRADRTELEQVPGIGPHLADAIVAHRTHVGRFDSLDDLRQIKGIGPKTADKLRPWLFVEPAATKADDEVIQLARKVPAAPPPVATTGNKMRPGDPPLDLNVATEADFQRLPGIGPALAGRIVAAREAGPFRTVDDLRRVKGIGAKTLDGFRAMVTVKAR